MGSPLSCIAHMLKNVGTGHVLGFAPMLLVDLLDPPDPTAPPVRDPRGGSSRRAPL